MTSFQRPEVRTCPGCSAPFLHYPIRTINFSDYEYWSDGAPTAWWGREPLVRCDSCAALFWFDDTEAIGVLANESRPFGRLTRLLARWRGDPDGLLRDERQWQKVPDSWKTARSIGHVDFEDVRFVLANSDGLSLDRVLWLHRRIWWRLNDRFRVRSDGSQYPNVPTVPPLDEQANMEALLALLELADMKERDMLQKGELLRLLSRFDEAIAVLRAVPPDGHSEVLASMIERLARQGDTNVQLLITL